MISRSKSINKFRNLSLAALTLLAPFAVEAQLPTIQWQQAYGGSKIDSLTAVESTDALKGYIIGGSSYSGQSGDKKDDNRGGSDYWVIKIDDNGNPEWQLTLGGKEDDVLKTIKPIKEGDGGFILGGYSNSSVSGDKKDPSQGGFDYWIIKLDPKGGIEWQRTIGGSGDDYLSFVYPDPDGNGYIAGGWSSSNKSGDKSADKRGDVDFWVVKLSDDGSNIEWDRTYGGKDGSSFLMDMAAFKGNYILGGYSNSKAGNEKTEDPKGGYDYWIMEIDGSSGSIQWQSTIGGDQDDKLAAILREDMSEGYILAGTSASDKSGDRTDGLRGGTDYWIVRVKGQGSPAFDIAFGSKGDDILTSARPVAEGKEGYIFGGWSTGDQSGEKSEDSYGGTADYWIVRMNENDKMSWDMTVGGKSGDDVMGTIIPTSDAGFLAGGTSYSDKDGDKTVGTRGDADYWLIKFQGCIPVSSTATASVCQGSNYTLPDGRTVSNPGTYTSLVTGPTGCLDTVFTVLTQLPRYSITEKDTICQGETYTLPDGREVSIGGSYALGFRTVDGCDSMYTIQLYVNAPDTSFATAGICNGEGYLLPGGRTVYTPGIYTDLVSKAGSCDTVVVTTLDVFYIDAGVTQSGDTLSADQTALDTYQWINCATMQPVAGATSSSFVPTDPGFYAVAVSLNGCTDTSACFPVRMEGMSVDLLDMDASIKIYPNPANEQVIVKYNNGTIINSVAIYNTLGAVVYAHQPNSSATTINTTTMAVGTYIIRVTTAQGMEVHRINISR